MIKMLYLSKMDDIEYLRRKKSASIQDEVFSA